MGIGCFRHRGRLGGRARRGDEHGKGVYREGMYSFHHHVQRKAKVLTPGQSSTIPSTLRDLHDPLAAARFEEYYMHQLTSEFGDDLNAVRLSKDFGANSLPMLVRALKQGINIFDVGEKRVVVGV